MVKTPTIHGTIMLTRGMAIMLADCIDLGIDGCGDNDENSPAEVEALQDLSVILRDAATKEGVEAWSVDFTRPGYDAHVATSGEVRS